MLFEKLINVVHEHAPQAKLCFNQLPSDVAGKNTTPQFGHAGWREETEYFRSCNTTWGELMYRLKAASEGKGRGPLFRAKDLAY